MAARPFWALGVTHPFHFHILSLSLYCGPFLSSFVLCLHVMCMCWLCFRFSFRRINCRYLRKYLHAIESGAAVGFLSSWLCVPSAGRMCTWYVYKCIMYMDLACTCFFPVTRLHALLLVKKDVQAMTGYDSPDCLVERGGCAGTRVRLGRVRRFGEVPTPKSANSHANSLVAPCFFFVGTYLHGEVFSSPHGLTRTMHCSRV